jgi:hypothetical protein
MQSPIHHSRNRLDYSSTIAVNQGLFVHKTYGYQIRKFITSVAHPFNNSASTEAGGDQNESTRPGYMTKATQNGKTIPS